MIQNNRSRLSLLAFLTLVLPLLLAELYVRFFSPVGFITPQILKEKSLPFIPVVNEAIFPTEVHDSVNSTGARLHLNSKGYRGQEFEFKKPPGRVRIVFYGGSSVFDIGASDPGDWPHRVETFLHDKGFSQVEVVNAGIPGLNSVAALGNFLTEGYRLEPDYVVMYCSWNDIAYFSFKKPLLRLFQNRIHPVPLFEYQNFLDQWLCEISQLYVRLRYRYFLWRDRIGLEGRVPKGTPTDEIDEKMLLQYRLSLQTFVDAVRNIGAVPVLMTEGTLVNAHNSSQERKKIRYEYQNLTPQALARAYELANGIVRETAEEKNAKLIDASKVITGRNIFFNDHVHLSSEGSKVLAEFTAGIFSQWLQTDRPT